MTAWSLPEAAHGDVAVQRLAEGVGWSRRHLASCFKADIGMSPKTAARILRFEQVTALLRTGAAASLADAAYDCGYADQAHLNRDFRVRRRDADGLRRAGHAGRPRHRGLVPIRSRPGSTTRVACRP
ncbi:MAG: hypothetical protein QOG15_677 [Solirubrobacteraceae bacterium]|nr:hypothetical protein [Solirubrobacteraceae bacterium]